MSLLQWIGVGIGLLGLSLVIPELIKAIIEVAKMNK